MLFLAGTVLSIALVLAYAALWSDAPFRTSDTARYVEAAADLSDGSIDTYQARTPGFPLMLLLVGTGRGFFVTALALHIAAVALLIASLRSAQVSVFLIALFGVLALLPPFVQNAAYVMTETLTEFLLVAGFCGLWFFVHNASRTALLLSGCAFAFATLTRPQNILLVIAIGVAFAAPYGWRRGIRTVMLLIAPSIVVVGGYILYNYVKFGEPQMTYMLGYHLGTRTTGVFEDIPDKEVRQIMVESRNHAIETGQNPLWTTWETRQRLMDVKHLSMVELAKYMKQIHLQLIRSHPTAYLLEVGRTLIYYWSPAVPSQTNRSAVLKLLTFTTQVVLAISFALVCILASGLYLARLVLAIPNWINGAGDRLLYASLMITIFYTALLSCALDWGDPRYRSPTDLLILFAVVLSVHFVKLARAHMYSLNYASR
jgi:hypothetical protein